MVVGHEFATAAANPLFLESTTISASPRGPALDEMPAGGPEPLESLILAEWLPQRRDHERRLQQVIDAVETQVALLDERGAIVAVNRAWRLAAYAHGLNDLRHGVGRNYLSICRAAAVEGCRDATEAAHGLEGVMAGRWRSFFYKYAWRGDGEQRIYAMLAWNLVEDGITYTAVSHELLESRPDYEPTSTRIRSTPFQP